MRRARALAGLSVAFVLLATACGTTEDASDDSTEAGSTSEATDGGDAAAGPITVTDSRGVEVTLDQPAVRVAATEWNAVENLVSLGVMPVGVSDIQGYNNWVSGAPLDDTVTDIGTRGEPSMDTLATLDVDLVVVTDSLIEGAIEQIEATTPVVVMPGGDVQDNIGQMFANLDLIAELTGTQDRAQELRDEFDAKVEEGKAAVEEAGATGDPVAFADSWVDAGTVSIRPFAEGSLVSDVFGEIGLENPWPMEGDPVYGLAQTDVEGLTALPGDVRFWYMANDNDGGDAFADNLAGNAIWESLPFVQAGNVVRFPDSLWMFGGPTSMMQYVDAAVDALG
ncbi:iron-siderophore ABC transporter substrate-binding protein [Jiangella aurantiaca]|uniref:Iron-siderophore ABC transporter substrate-binding protein n=1 Tax=Jiangella aurantiaca TaxID=2530373 RepID=A0A4R5A7B4_9ACTN|nr:iron-siderophore ABC transporter substrate-binding protein [Jiangella aurantiaca]TDD67881.1 iron-siderophore ABC transporter substrate-binding protein [Jiangella aurantiaca]